jgi:hypothetical protein
MADSGSADAAPPAAVGSVANLYLGNILFALERCAMALDDDAKPDESSFYRGIARKLAEARTTDRSGPGGPSA